MAIHLEFDSTSGILRAQFNKIAYVVSNQLGYGLMRMFQVLTDTEEDSLVSYEYDEAERWLRDAAPAPHSPVPS